MASFAKQILSQSTDGRGILIAQTATPGTLIRTGSTNTAIIDEIWLYAHNSSTSSVKLTIEWGAATAPNDHIELTVAGESGLVMVAPGLLIRGNASALTVRAFAATTNVISIHGYVNRIT